MFNSYMKVKDKSCNKGISAPCCSSVHKKKIEEHYSAPIKTKRLKTIKERNQIRWQRSNRSNQSHQHCERGSKDKGHCSERHDYQCSRSLIFSRKEKPVAKPFPSQKPSIITEGRLTSIRGLFSHEVRSVDIERLVKEKNHRKHTEEQATASNSPSHSCLITHSTPPGVISETSEEGISACANKDQKSDILEKTDHLQTNLDSVLGTMHSGDGGAHKTTCNTAMCGSLSGEKGIQKAVIFSLSESEPVHRSSPTSVRVSLSDYNDNPKKKHKHGQKLTNKATAAVDVQPDFINTKTLTPVESEVLNLDASQFNTSPAIFMISSPTMDRENTVLGDERQHKKPVFSSKEEAVSRLAARLCDSLVSFPLQHDCPLLTECRSVLMHHLQERHGSQLQHSLHRLQSHFSAEGPNSSQTAEQVWPSGPSMQKYSDNTQMYFRKNEKHDQQSETMESQTDNDLPKHCLREGSCENVERGAASREQRQCPWGIYSLQDFDAKLQRPSQNTLSQSSITAQSEEPLTAKQQSNSQRFSLQQSFTGPQTSTPWSYNCTDRILDPFFLEPQKQVKLGSDENRGTGLQLLEQWRNDPDLDFLFQEEDSNTTHTSPLTELRTSSAHHNIENVSERPLFGASSTVLSLFSPKGFHYKPYYRFPHPSYSFNSSLYTLDVEKRSLCPSLHLTTPYFDYWP